MMPRYELGSSYFKIINHQYLGRFCRKNLQPQVYLKASKTAEDFVMPTSILLPKNPVSREIMVRKKVDQCSFWQCSDNEIQDGTDLRKIFYFNIFSPFLKSYAYLRRVSAKMGQEKLLKQNQTQPKL